MQIEDKLSILAAAAKYDVSCASSGSRRSNTGRGLGNAIPAGVCHTFTEDGRCVSLLKLLFTNFCIFDCAYCVNRRSNDLPRAAFTPAEIVRLTIDFYRRNYIEGLFLSSGVVGSPDETMERLIRTVTDLRRQGFNGYVHLKCVPHTSRRLVQAAGRLADRLSVNIELPTEESLRKLTREKTYASVLTPMGVIREGIEETREDRKRLRHVPAFAPAGQSTQLIVGASPESDHTILHLSDRLYRQQALKRVYYSAYVPVGDIATHAGAAPPFKRENRLYQADWLIRLYGFSIDEVIPSAAPNLDLTMDPKDAFARRHPQLFPVDVNSADRKMILRVPGIGIRSANCIVDLRRRGRIRFEHLKQMGVVVTRALPFIRCDGLPDARWTVPYSATAIAPPVALTPLVFVTDSSFDGLLTAIFEAYAGQTPPDAIQPDSHVQQGLFDQRVTVVTDGAKAARVWKGLKRCLGVEGRQAIAEAFLSGNAGVETLIYTYVRERIPRPNSSPSGVSLGVTIRLDQLARKVREEARRLEGFVRFEQTGKGRYLARIAPRYDVLPLIRHHFESRFADQRWIIYDTVRQYGLVFDGRTTRALPLNMAEPGAGSRPDADESLCQRLWQRYYHAVNIPTRNHPRLHRRLLPRRYWAYLTEKLIPLSRRPI
ncbi:hypothetical protein DSCO28_30900 [Desulfosarcina ovata subsp. sediminis]|uniref:Uncharacterized protein n=1 Tax=Desulfosarcina ovata subsp. sediminis TaxID=885957 RepID=A0A5K7ZM10_9BACT|nr:putative DNA modification/repair radical SAM protein [Desulfosarcina ovata]BBO82524.1 hypothetical protein DSCO28_30900 [Desulfosarcina ovata subsp. sediminis]